MSQQNSRRSKEDLSKCDITNNFYQSMALAAAFAARNGLSSPPAASASLQSFHPAVFPYANPYGLSMPSFLPGSNTSTSAFPALYRSGASALTNDYLLAMAGNLHNFQAGMSNNEQRQQQPQSPTNRGNAVNVTSGNNNSENNAEESFEEMLHKISQMSNKSNAAKADSDSLKNAVKQSNSNRGSQENQSPTSSQKLVTLAHIASCISSNDNPEPDTTTTVTATMSDDRKNLPQQVASTQKRKIDVEQDEVSSTSDSFVSKKSKTSDVSPGKLKRVLVDNHRKIFDRSTSPFKSVDPALLNASAVAWAALSNQLLLAASLQRSGDELRSEDKKSPKSSANHTTASGVTCPKAVRSSISPLTPTKGRSNVMNGTLDQERVKKSQNSEHRKQISAIIDHLTLRQKQMMKSPKTKNAALASDDGPVLDLSVKGYETTKELDTNRNQSHHSDCGKGSFSRPSKSVEHSPNQNDHSNADPMTIPMSYGWRRQTCVRTISATGVRGDVIYYAPCGRRLGSYAEVVRYLSKNKIKNLSRQNFSFSSKVVVGEFLHVKFENGKNTVALLNDKDVKSMILRLQNSSIDDSNCDDSPSNTSIRLRSATLKNIPNNEDKQRPENRKRGRPPLSTITSFPKPEISSPETASAMKSKRGRPNSINNLTIADIQKRVGQSVFRMKAENPTSVVNNELLKTYEQLRLIYQKSEAVPDPKLLKIPMDDLDLQNSIALKGLKRIENMRLDSKSFADLLMVVEFVRNFGPVLKIGQEDIPDIDSLHAGLFNVKRHSKSVLKLAKILLTLVLEYPGIPTGPNSRLKSGQSYKDITVDYINMSEMMLLFLDSRCAQGRALSIPLQNNCFEALRPSDKISILAYMCNELLYCRNVVREIETNVDILSKCRSDKWLMENKRKQLRTMRENNNIKNAAKSKAEIDDDSALAFEADKMGEDVDEDETLDKLKQRILTESESLTNEVADMTEEEVGEKMNDLDKNIASTNSRVKEATVKVRTLPLGQDRYFRLYWSLPSSSTSGILVESLESQVPSDQSSNLSIPDEISRMVKNDSVLEDVEQCIEFLLDSVCECCTGKVVAEKYRRPKNEKTIIPSEDRNGWYRIQDKTDLLELEKTLNCRGIKEKLLHRVLTYKIERQTNEQLFKKEELLTTNFVARAEFETRTAANLAKMHKIYARLRNLEEKIFIAGINVKNAKPPPSPDSTNQDLDLHCRKIESSRGKRATQKSTNQITSSSSKRGRSSKNSSNRVETDKEANDFSTSDFSDSDIDGDSNDSIFDFIFELEENVISQKGIDRNDILAAMSRDLDYLTDIMRTRLLLLENNVEKRYLQPAFQEKSPIAGANENDDSNSNVEKTSQPNLGSRKRWLEALADAKSAAQFALCLDFLDKNICWERSAMKAMCQICRRGDNDSQLLLCDGCDLGYHTYCFKPEMSNIPDTDWFCPECVSQATRRPCCLLCCRQTSRPMITCYECDRRFHCDCASDSKKQLEPDQKNWLCQGCESLSKDKDTNNTRNKKIRQKFQKDSIDSKNPKKKMKGRRKSSVDLNSKKGDALHFTEICSILMADLDTHKDAWPFKSAVDPKTCPLYGKIIKKPMDLSLIQEKLVTKKYKNADDFVADIKLMFNNCKTFNEDDSAIGKSGRSLKKFFVKRWRELNEISSIT